MTLSLRIALLFLLLSFVYAGESPNDPESVIPVRLQALHSEILKIAFLNTIP